MVYKALTIIQPYANLIVDGHKRIETRSHNIYYRGKILIHAGKTNPESYTNFHKLTIEELMAFKSVNMETIDKINNLPKGVIVGSADILGSKEIDLDFIENVKDNNYNEYVFGNYKEGRYAWVLGNIKKFKEPIPARGYMGLWDFETDIEL